MQPIASPPSIAALERRVRKRDPDRHRIKKNPDDFRTVSRQLQLDVVSRHIDCRPRIFPSYPGQAGRRHAKVLRARLKAKGFKTIIYQQPDGQRLLEEARRRILRSDFFIGLWLPDTPVGRAGLPGA